MFGQLFTSFTIYQEDRSEVPATVICFTPYAKENVLLEYGMTLNDFQNTEFPDSLYDYVSRPSKFSL